ncbi:MAG: MarR family transcriptional regulator [Hyphomicrobiales bacterium]|nr:MarR family transcriptional regulator [Hyphomicrobiales bacterium]
MTLAKDPAAARPARRSSVSKQRLRAWLKLLKTSRHIESHVRDRLRTGFDTTLPRFDVLAALYRNRKGLKMSELSGALRVSNGNVTGIVDRLVQDGALVRVAVPGDRRAQLVRLTKKGTSEFEAMAAAHEAWVNGIFAGLTAADCDQLMTLLDAVDQSAAEAGKRSGD